MGPSLQQIWYRAQPPPAALLPLERLYSATADRIARRRRARASALPAPVIVVGNLTAGGAGKTPFVLWLAQLLSACGLRPGIVSRGYGGHAHHYPLLVTAATDPRRCGDEPALLAQRLGVPVAVAPDRVAAAQMLLARGDVDVLIADDGLQHYALARDFEICVIDGLRGLGNGHRLPAGPLREPPQRLQRVDLIVFNGTPAEPRLAGGRPAITMQLEIESASGLARPVVRPLRDFASTPVHAVAGIGDPARFFASLHGHGLQLHAHPFPDHYRFAASDLDFGDDLPVLMTEKDAVKCRAFAQANHWVVAATTRVAADERQRVQELLVPILPASWSP